MVVGVEVFVLLVALLVVCGCWVMLLVFGFEVDAVSHEESFIEIAFKDTGIN